MVFRVSLAPKETVRIFTGAPVPDGCDTILIQENARVEAGFVEPLQSVASGRHIRAKGIDFTEGEVLLAAGTRLGASNIALAAAMNFAEVAVTRRPRVGILATGDELVHPGAPVGADQIVASNSFAIAALVEAAGGEALDLGIARDELGALDERIAAARAAADVLVTLGGASVGDHDLVKPALAKQGMELNFWKIAMRPGKPVTPWPPWANDYPWLAGKSGCRVRRRNSFSCASAARALRRSRCGPRRSRTGDPRQGAARQRQPPRLFARDIAA